MKKRLHLLIFCMLIVSAVSAQYTSSANTQFTTYKKAFIDRFWKINPEWATYVGYHKYDSILPIPNGQQRTKELVFYKKELKKLSTFPYDKLSDLNKIDYKILENELQKYIWQIEVLKEFEWNPSYFNVGGTFSYILSENYSPIKKRLSDTYIRLKNVPAYYEAAKSTIKNPSKEHLQLAIEQNEGSLSIFENDYIDSVKLMHFSKEKETSYLKRGEKAVAAIKSYIQFLKEYKTDSARSFRLGSDLYADKFKYDIQSQFTVDEIYKAAVDRKQYLHQEMFKLSAQLWPKYFNNTPIPTDTLELIKKVIDTISVQHVKPEDFQVEIEKQLPELSAFVAKKDLIYMDPNKPLKVRKEPAYMAGVAGASMSSPGPYEKNGTAYYNVGTLEGWEPERAESYLREYNKYVLQILNIHEAIPGHYVQLVYSNKSPSIIKSVFGNGAMIEGWAVYSELMMLENGYGNNEPEMWLMYYKWNLRATCNTILDIGVHTKNMSKEDAMDLLSRQAFQQKAEAEGKWNRVQLTSVQLCSYFTGFYEIIQLRETYKKSKASAFNVKHFNEDFLGYGSSPVKYIRQMLLPKN
ncbi:MAG TPA: DUF885 domain-containing protein [Chitinophagales bacterium]|jgi:uncharacterized protein (DUF885 family)|nr:DUF885 domain-containing protein [Chitinophagales bacterium]